MKNKQLYFSAHEDLCYSLDFHKEYMKENGLKELKLWPAKIVISSYFYCQHFEAIGEKGTCGKQCNAYQPRNGKSGICKHYRQTREPADNFIIITI
jgi:hypothetical protein